jgi:hypothetical protein
VAQLTGGTVGWQFCDERLLIGTFTNEASVEEVGEDGKGEM